MRAMRRRRSRIGARCSRTAPHLGVQRLGDVVEMVVQVVERRLGALSQGRCQAPQIGERHGLRAKGRLLAGVRQGQVHLGGAFP